MCPGSPVLPARFLLSSKQINSQYHRFLSEEPSLPSNRSTPYALRAQQSQELLAYQPGLRKDADTELIQQIAEDDQVESITEEQIAHLIEPVDMKNVEALADEHQWGVVKIQAPEAWQELGTLSGEGVIIATVDTGVRGTHEALKDNFVGEYGWFDPSTSTPEPTDNNGQEPIPLETIAGGKGIGVAPGAKWAACRGCASSACWQSDLLACGDFFACPTRADGSSPDCSKAPNVVSNSWGGGRGNTWYNEVIEGWHAAKIIPLFSNGNSGPSCNTANSPADQNVIAVGSTTIDDAISSFSSVGPTTDGRMKPEVSAPGSNVISAYHTSDTAYVSLSGTSMACPHAAGAIALLQVRTRTFLTSRQRNFFSDKPIKIWCPAEGLAKESLIMSSPTTCLELDVSTPSRVSELKPLPCKFKSELLKSIFNCTVSFLYKLLYKWL
ncbi:Bacillopeptidase F [Orchesella cincta]|uniref:Bacillopeptidase F n=1 Tax=Orchesella cincta TaxID=48709 RepID=A0A1D2M3B1_ORCCI|nr:Bacillopeptidase F [Orchesella cincta]